MIRRFLFSAVVLACCPLAAGDVFLLANGGRVEGKLLNPEESPRRVYEVEPQSGGLLRLPEADVDRVIVQTEVEQQYEAFLPTMQDTEADHWNVAEKCGQVGLKEQREFHLEQVLRHNPDHEGARYALGYSRVAGKWQRQEDYMEAQGYVRHRGSWRLPQDVRLEERQQADEMEAIEWRKKVKLWRSWIVKGRDRVQEGRDNLQSIRDPLAAVALEEALKEEQDSKLKQPLKLLYIELLAQWRNEPALRGLIWASLQDPDVQVREKALEALAKSGSPSAVNTFIKTLEHNENRMVHRAAIALSYMNQPSVSTLPLIDALITEHKRVIGGGGIQPTFSNAGSGLSVGGKPKVIKEKVQNEPVLHALTAMHSVNYSFNQDAWRSWYISENTPRDVNLRRGD